MISKKADKKRQFYKYLSILIFIGGGVIFLLLIFGGRQQDLNDTTQMAQETLTFLKGTCQRYDNYHIGIDTDARENLLDKSKTLQEYMSGKFLEDDKELLKFAKLQDITGICIIDKDLKINAQADIRGVQTDKIWEEYLRSESKKNIVTNSVKTFSEKVQIGKTTYYTALMSRKDKKGLILCYQVADELKTDRYNTAFSALMKNNTFHKNPKILITDGKSILSTNALYLKKIKWTKNMPVMKIKWSEHKLTKIKFQRNTFYGMRQVYGRYYIYVCYEEAEVFSNLVPIVTVGVALYVFLLMSILLVRQNMRQRNIVEQARQIQTIEAISSLYVSTALLDLKTKECTPIQYSERLHEALDNEIDGDKILQILVNHLVAPQCKEKFGQFIKPENISQKMKQKKESLVYIYQDIKGRWYITYIVPTQYDENGDVRVVLFATRDIDEHQKKEIAYQEKLKKTAEDAELANAAKTTFLRRMSHDIRTPINGIRGMATLAKQHIHDPEKEEEYINKIITSTDYLLELVSDVLQMNKLESGKIYLENKPFDMRELVKEIVGLCKIQADKQDIKMNLKELCTEHSHLIGSPLHVRQIMQNLITNAIRYNRVGGSVDVTWKEIAFDGEKATYQFICADNGKGMGEEFQKHLYEPFAQENDDGRSTYSGTGLGLPIVKQLVEYMDGTIEFTSKKGKGTTFIVTLVIQVDMNYRRNVQKDIEIEEMSIEGVKILLVEDNEINMQIAKELLEENGAVITEAHNGQEAVQIFKESEEGEFDVVLMDIMMPVMNGLDATRHIRGMKREDALKIPIFAMTANAFIEDMRQSKEAGMNEHFSKPLNIENLIKTICRYKKR